MSVPSFLTAVSTADMASSTAASLILPTRLPTALVAAGTAATSFVRIADTTASQLISMAAATTAAASGASSGGKRVLTPEQKIVMAYRTKWSGRMPMVFYVILAILFGLWFLLDQPRVFARLVSSPLSRVCRFARKGDKQGQTAQQAEPGTRADLHRKRTVGGELWSGWILKKSGLSDGAKTKGSSKNVSHQYPPVQIVRTPADAIDDPSIRRPAPAVVAHDHFVAPRFLSSEEKHRLSTIEDLCEETPPMNDGDDDDNFLLPALSQAAPIYQTHRRNDSRPNLGRIDTNVNNGNGSESRGLTRHSSFASAVESVYSQETTCVGHESLDGHEDKFMYLKKSQLLRNSPGTLPPSAISAALTSATLQGSGPASGLLSACTEAPLLSATASPRFGEGLKRMTIANEAVLHQLSPPPRIPSLFDRIPAFQKILLWVPLPSLLPRLTFLDVFVYSLYAGVVAFASFYKNTEWEWNAKKNPLGPDLLRSGAMSMAQVPLVIGLGGRNSPIRYLLGGGQSRAVINLHKFSGRACFACMLLHVGGYGYKWGKSGIFVAKAKESYIMWGLTGVAGLTFMVITSLPPVRRRLYNLFMISHILGLVAFLLGLGMHVPEVVPYCIAGAGLYAFELVCRVVKTKIATAEFKVMAGADSILVTIPDIQPGWRAGQHVILRVPALPKKKGLQFLEGHVFTIASAPGTNGLVMIVKRTGGWTQALYDLALNKDDPEAVTRASNRFTVLCEGPYGGCGHSLFASYSSVMLVAGGSGITHTLGMAHDLICKAASQDAIRATHLDIIWVVRTAEIARPLMITFKSLIEDIKRSSLKIRVTIYVTRPPPHGGMDLLSPSTQEKMNAPFALPGTMAGGVTLEPQLAWSCGSGSRISIVPGARPIMDHLLQDLIDSSLEYNTSAGTQSQGCGIAVCGPNSLVHSVRKATMDIDATRRLNVGGIELLQERFD